MKAKKLLVLGGTRISCEIVSKAKQMGYYVVVADYNEPKASPAKLIADESFMTSAIDVNGVVDLIKREKIDGVMVGFADVLLPYYADICEKAGLPSMGTREQFELFIDKNKYKKILQKYGIPTPASYEINCTSMLRNVEIQYPVIVKPSDSSGARGCIIVSDKKDFDKALFEATQFSKTNSAIIEEFVNGPEVTVFYLIQDGKPFCTAVANRHVENNQGKGVLALPVGYTFPSVLTKRYMDEVAPSVDRMLEEEGIKNGMLFMQCVVKNGIPMVYDMGLRLTGSLEYYILDKACGFNPLEMMIRFAVTGSMGDPVDRKVDPYLKGKFGWNISALMKPGKIAKIIGLQEISQCDDVIASVASYEEGEELTDADKGLLKQIGCRFLGVSETRTTMKYCVDKVLKTFDVLDEKGESLLLPQMDLKKYEGTF